MQPQDKLLTRGYFWVSFSSIHVKAGLLAGATESLFVVTPMDVIKIRLQSQRHSLTDPGEHPKYRNAAHCVYVMIKEEGIGALYKGVGLTVLRQGKLLFVHFLGSNQAANFTVYQYLRKRFSQENPDGIPWYTTLGMGFVSGACGPLFNAPIDTIKTRIQKNPSKESGWVRFKTISSSIYKNEGFAAFYKGLTPRVLRVAPGQAITFMVYERVYAWLIDLSKNLRVEEIDQAHINEDKIDN